MPNLSQSLEGKDLGHIKIVAELWGIEIQAQDALDAIQQLSPALLNSALVQEVVEALPDEARHALDDLCGTQGRLPWTQFTRRYGKVRELGAARRDKEKVHRNPTSTSERLWYRGIIARAFFDSPDGPREFAYIPDDLLTLLPSSQTITTQIFGRPARPKERKHVFKANDRILDEACTLLAASRIGIKEAELEDIEDWRMPPKALSALLTEAGILGADGVPISEATRGFLEAGRSEMLFRLARAWLESEAFSELHLMPGLHVEGKWKNNPRKARQKILGFVQSAPRKEWWSLAALITDVKKAQPDFQRPAGDYDSWYLRDKESGDFLRGYKHWDKVDGALIAYLVRGPLHWLGIVDLAAASESGEAWAFRLSAWAGDLLNGRAPSFTTAKEGKLSVDSQGLIQVPRSAERALRYQIARFCEWDKPKRGNYRYRLTAASLGRAKSQGLEIRQLIKLLKAQSSSSLPPNLLTALKRWGKHSTQAKLSEMMVLRLSTTAMMKALRDSRAARYLGDPLGPTTIAVKAGAERHVLRVLVELGYLGEFTEESD